MIAARHGAGALALVTFMVATNACGPRPVTTELADARGAYDRAARTASRQQLVEARRVLDAAEKLQREDPGSNEAKDIAYAAHRKALVAESTARTEALRTSAAAMLPTMSLDEATVAKAPDQVGVDARSAKRSLEGLSPIGVVTTETRGTVLTLEASTLFGVNSASLMPSGRERLDLVAKTLRTSKEEVTVVGHAAGREGKTAVERSGDLARKLADAVAAHLGENGVARERIRIESHEKDRARAGEDDRVEIVLGGRE